MYIHITCIYIYRYYFDDTLFVCILYVNVHNFYKSCSILSDFFSKVYRHQDFPGGPGGKTSPSGVVGMDLIPGWPHVLGS